MYFFTGYTLVKFFRTCYYLSGPLILIFSSFFSYFHLVLSTKTSSTGKRPFDLHAAYSTINADEDLKKRPNFRPLDFKCITPFNVKYGRVPGLFEPRKPGDRKPSDSPSKRRGRGGRGGRGRGRGGRGRGRSRGRGGRGRGNN